LTNSNLYLIILGMKSWMEEKLINLCYERNVQGFVIMCFFIFIVFRIISKKSVKSVMKENSFLRKFKHPFLVNMVFAF